MRNFFLLLLIHRRWQKIETHKISESTEIKRVFVSIANIPATRCSDNNGDVTTCLGCVTISDTFIDSHIKVAAATAVDGTGAAKDGCEDGGCTRNNNYILLTKIIPKYSEHNTVRKAAAVAAVQFYNCIQRTSVCTLHFQCGWFLEFYYSYHGVLLYTLFM